METVKLNMTPKGVMPHLYCSRYDIGRQFGLVIYDDSGTYQIPTGAVATLHGTKPDGKVITYGSADSDPKVTIDGSTVIITTTEQMTAVVGNVVMELIISQRNGDKETVLGSLNFILEVEEAALPDDDKTSQSDLETYEEMINSAKDANALFKAFGIHSTLLTLQASNWVGDKAPYSYELGSDYVGMGTLVALTNDATDLQLGVWKLAEIYGGIGTKLYARKTKPTEDLPVILVYSQIHEEA